MNEEKSRKEEKRDGEECNRRRRLRAACTPTYPWFVVNATAACIHPPPVTHARSPSPVTSFGRSTRAGRALSSDRPKQLAATSAGSFRLEGKTPFCRAVLPRLFCVLLELVAKRTGIATTSTNSVLFF